MLNFKEYLLKDELLLEVVSKTTEKEYHDSAKVDLDTREKEAFQNYTGAMFRDMNSKLRQGKSVSKGDKEDLKFLDNVFKRAKITKDIKVYRGLDAVFGNTLKKGETYTELSFMSTSTDKKVADIFTGRGIGRIIMEILVPKGTSAISANDFSQFKNGKSGGEKEILLNRGMEYKIIDVKEPTRTKPKIIIAEVV